MTLDPNELLGQADEMTRSDDPYERQNGHDQAAHAYRLLSQNVEDHTWKLAALAAADHHDHLAACIRHEHRIPTLLPKTEAARLHGGMCAGCGRQWLVVADPDDSCPECPTILVGPSPTSRADAETMPPGHPVERGNVLSLWVLT